jgi:hypothetical protein
MKNIIRKLLKEQLEETVEIKASKLMDLLIFFNYDMELVQNHPKLRNKK